MSDDKYMNGIGLMEKTRCLEKKLWDAVLPAWLGSSVGLSGVGLSLLLMDDGATGFIFSAIFAAVAYFSAKPWFLALAEQDAHRRSMEAENKKRGDGWAKS